MRELERAFKAAGDPTRTRILKLLQTGELCVCQVQAVLRLAPSTVSKHLGILKAAGLVEDRRDGRWAYYSLSPEPRNGAAAAVVHLIRGQLKGDPRIERDACLLRDVCRVPVSQLCGAAPKPRPRRALSTRRSQRRV